MRRAYRNIVVGHAGTEQCYSCLKTLQVIRPDFEIEVNRFPKISDSTHFIETLKAGLGNRKKKQRSNIYYVLRHYTGSLSFYVSVIEHIVNIYILWYGDKCVSA